ncbi:MULTISPECIES: DUF3375 domain-containing protein [unclassified Rathayibacter]|uniref:DUF3375 domain-containing protein n=1 Tax=unclassified Rathayibacter TaxID=2609250 RepID=UPI00188CA742|nr:MULTISPECIES: DUF3375 domain-containing protein [unclassified Rathayibacter]MBF4462591.1 DUF3375 domain-containing protein [Rathayibacter sp. VKM Ac-2879]MBF4503366.1 DUF3375 domain-containing protein [Rathayibacter sp. VKM Ac-2878]
MTSSRAEAAYLRSLGAFRTPTLDLLHGRHAPFVVATLSLVFTVDRQTVAVSDAHAEVAEILEELRSAGYGEGERSLPRGGAREICRSWVRVGWLVPQIDGDAEVYRLSAHAVSALEITGRTGGGRTRVSSSRVRTLLDAVGRLAADVETDPAARLARLVEERDRLDAEIARLGESGEPEPVDDEQLLEEAENVVHLARELPADFARVAESIKAMQRDVVAELRRDVRPTGEVLREYLERGQHVMQSTSEGRAFAGALRLLGDPERIDTLTEQLHAVLVQPFSRLMDATQRAELSAIGRRVELGVQEVLTAQRRASHVITGQVRTHDPARDRQVDELLRDVMAGLQEWTAGAEVDAPVEPLRHLPVAAIGALRRTLGDVRPASAPAALNVADDDAEFVDEDSRAWGGPRYAELEAYVAGLGDEFDLADAFSAAPEDTRRPVDLLGLLEIAHRAELHEGEGYSVVRAHRPDGTTRRFAFASVTARFAEEAHDE